MTTGYQGVILCRVGTRKYMPIHRLVTLTFYGPRPSNLVTRHLDGNKLNNRLDNLAYGTNKENTDDRDKHGRTVRGEKHRWTKLTDAEVYNIRLLHSTSSITYAELGRMFNISSVRIRQLVQGNQRILTTNRT